MTNVVRTWRFWNQIIIVWKTCWVYFVYKLRKTLSFNLKFQRADVRVVLADVWSLLEIGLLKWHPKYTTVCVVPPMASDIPRLLKSFAHLVRTLHFPVRSRHSSTLGFIVGRSMAVRAIVPIWLWSCVFPKFASLWATSVTFAVLIISDSIAQRY